METLIVATGALWDHFRQLAQALLEQKSSLWPVSPVPSGYIVRIKMSYCHSEEGNPGRSQTNLMPTVLTLLLSIPEAEGKEQEKWSLI